MLPYKKKAKKYVCNLHWCIVYDAFCSVFLWGQQQILDGVRQFCGSVAEHMFCIRLDLVLRSGRGGAPDYTRVRLWYRPPLKKFSEI